MPSICHPASAHQLELCGTLTTELPGRDGRYQVISFHRCTVCWCCVETSGRYHPKTRRVQTLTAYLWRPLHTEPLLIVDGEVERVTNDVSNLRCDP